MQNVSRRQFSRRLLHVLLYGEFAHFTFANMAKAQSLIPPLLPPICPGGGHNQDLCLPATLEGDETDVCPGGKNTEDVCLPEQGYTDACPGEKMPEDECQLNDDRNEDLCLTGLADADVCVPGILIKGQSPDQCPAQNTSTDVCNLDENSKFDVCWSSLPQDDECAPDGGRETDECSGGGRDRDTCEKDGKGDECSLEQQPEHSDECPADWGLIDTCGLAGTEDSDVCYAGTNTPGGLGGTDHCNGAWGLNIGGGDTCLDGSTIQDVCGGVDDTHDEYDVCSPTKEGEMGTDDLCNPADYNGSEDVCLEGLLSSDNCEGTKDDSDECPGGGDEVDQCPTGMPPEDECPGGASGVDDCNSLLPGSDEPCESDKCEEKDNCESDDICASDDLCVQKDHVE